MTSHLPQRRALEKYKKLLRSA